MARVALVTGGSRGIGAAISVALKAAGYKVAANYAGNDEAAAAFTKETGIPTYKWSVAEYDACAAGIAKVEAEVGPVDILVNNAGITRDAMFHKMTPAQWKEVIDTNLSGLFNMTHPLWSGMRDRKFGRVISISSINGQKGQAGQDELFGGQGRGPRVHQGAGAGRRAGRDHRERDLPRLYRDRDGEGHRREGAERTHHPADPGRPPGRAGGNCPDRGVPGQRRGGVHHRLDSQRERWSIRRLTRSLSAN
jgi:NAD(P)-dependent dehydrogenase (short-subunit alcohol dehydrogenase family)